MASTVSVAAVGVTHADQLAQVAGQGADFNGDGFDDLAVGAPFEDLGGVRGAGAVNVLYGSATGLTGGGSQLFTQDSPGVPGAVEDNDLFGGALATGS
jgi:FG-GAP repeat